MTEPRPVTLLAKGRFLLDLQPVEAPWAKHGAIFKWSVSDYDELVDYEGLCADAESGWRSCMEVIWKAVRGGVQE